MGAGHDEGDRGGQDYEDATHALIRTVYARGSQRRFHAHALELLVDALGAEGGLAVVQSRRSAMPKVSSWVPQGLDFRQAAVLKRCHTWLRSDDALGFADGAGFGLGLRCALSVRATHRGAGASLWLVGRARPFAAREFRRARVLAPHLGYAGELALSAKRPSASTPTISEAQIRGSTPQEVAKAIERLSELPDTVVDCARWAARGYTNHQVAANLNVSEATVARRLNRVYEALGISSRQELPIKAILAWGRPTPRGAE